MPANPPTAEQPDVACPHCGAMVNPVWAECWMCGLTISKTPSAGRQLVHNFRSLRESDLSRFMGWGVMATLGVLILLIIVGASSSDGWQVGAVISIFFLPAVIATVTRSLRRRAKAQPLSTWGQLGTFVVSLAITFASLFALAIAAGIALFVTCLAQMR
jgi:asparagine N-glycosylation enzyme membrane subunit Stt3